MNEFRVKYLCETDEVTLHVTITFSLIDDGGAAYQHIAGFALTKGVIFR